MNKIAFTLLFCFLSIGVFAQYFGELRDIIPYSGGQYDQHIMDVTISDSPYVVYDGDTFRADVSLPFSIEVKNVRFRMYALDCPEIRGKDREDGLCARDRMRDLILGKELQLVSFNLKEDKYGRMLVVPFLDGQNVSQILVDEGYCKTRYY